MSQKHQLIKARIRARKVTLSYFYWRIFVFRLEKNEDLLKTIVDTSHGLEEVYEPQSDEQQDLKDHLSRIFGESVEDDIDYIISYYFDEWKVDSIDMDYVLTVAQSFDDIYPRVATLVNEHTTSFQYEQMDPMDQALFVLGYAEYTTINTPKEIVINEIVELAKRYGDSGSAKLLHGIIHHIIW